MDVRLIKETELNQVNELWNTTCKETDFLYKELNKNEFRHKFYNFNDKQTIVSVVCFHENKLKGFSSGVYQKGTETAYITMLIVEKVSRRQGIGDILLEFLEKELKELSNDIKALEIVFRNPINLEWVIPGTISHDHPNSPGVDTASSGYNFFKNRGYDEFAVQYSYYRDIKRYELSKETIAKTSVLSEKGINIGYFDIKRHQGFDDLFDDLKSESWRKEILDEVHNKQSESKIIIVSRNSVIKGFTGPLRVQNSLRGYFCGIGVHSDCRGLGAGSVLFSYLCLGLKEQGASYMSLFTGKNNPARKIYEAEDFQIVREWSNMRKKIIDRNCIKVSKK